MSGVVGSLGRLLGLLVIAALSLQLYFLARVGAMAWLDPQSTAYQRSEAWRLATQKSALAWSHEWLPSARISANLKRAVIASEDAGFADHSHFSGAFRREYGVTPSHARAGASNGH